MTVALGMKMYPRLLMRTDLICLIYKSDHIKAELEHENDVASSDVMSSEWNEIRCE